MAGVPSPGYAGPNPQNTTDPNVNTHFDWYELNYGTDGKTSTVYINTTQVDQFGLPLLLDVYAGSGSFHKQAGITESIAQLDKEFATEVPAAFQPATMSNLRIFSPAKLGLAAGATYGNYFDAAIAQAWTGYQTTPLTLTLQGRTYSGTANGAALTFHEVNPSAAHTGESFVVQRPSTQDVLGCAGTMASGVAGNTAAQGDENGVQLQLENQICSAINRGGAGVTGQLGQRGYLLRHGSGQLLLQLLAPSFRRRASPTATPTTTTTIRARPSPRNSRNTWSSPSAGSRTSVKWLVPGGGLEPRFAQTYRYASTKKAAK